MLRTCGRIAGDLFHVGAGFAVSRMELPDNVETFPERRSREPMDTGYSATIVIGYVPMTCENPCYIDPKDFGWSMSKDESWQQ